jgi:hypothetical protein
MAQTVNILPHAEDRKRLLAIVADRNRPFPSAFHHGLTRF